MKKLFLTLAITAFALTSFSQTIKAESGKAIEVTPAVAEKKTTLTGAQVVAKKEKLNSEIKILENQISSSEKILADKKAMLAKYEAVCAELGYK